MTREELIRNLEYTMEKHKNDKIDTFGTNISWMCKDVLDYLKQEMRDTEVNEQVHQKNSTRLTIGSDLISRQAVLDETYNWSKDEFLRVTNPFDYLRKRINSLPSVTIECADEGRESDAE